MVALLAVDQGVGGTALRNLGVTLEGARQAVAAAMAMGSKGQEFKISEIIPTSRVKRVIERAFDNAQQEGRKTVDTGDLLIGLLLEKDGVAAQVLKERGLIIPAVRAELARIGPSGERETIEPEPKGFAPAPTGEWARQTKPPVWHLKFEGKPGPPLEVMVFFQPQYNDQERQKISDAILNALKTLQQRL